MPLVDIMACSFVIFCALSAVLVIAACMRSSQISREDER